MQSSKGGGEDSNNRMCFSGRHRSHPPYGGTSSILQLKVHHHQTITWYACFFRSFVVLLSSFFVFFYPFDLFWSRFPFGCGMRRIWRLEDETTLAELTQSQAIPIARTINTQTWLAAEKKLAVHLESLMDDDSRSATPIAGTVTSTCCLPYDPDLYLRKRTQQSAREREDEGNLELLSTELYGKRMKLGMSKHEHEASVDGAAVGDSTSTIAPLWSRNVRLQFEKRDDTPAAHAGGVVHTDTLASMWLRQRDVDIDTEGWRAMPLANQVANFVFVASVDGGKNSVT